MIDPAILSILHELRRRHDDREPPMPTRAICERWNLAPADLDRIADAIETHVSGVDVLRRRAGGANGGATWAIEPLPLSTDPADGSGWSGRPGAALPPVPKSGPYPPVAEKRPTAPYTATGATRAADTVSEAIERHEPVLSHADAVARAEQAADTIKVDVRPALARAELAVQIHADLTERGVPVYADGRVLDLSERIQWLATNTAPGIEWAVQFIRDDIDDVDRERTFPSGSPKDALTKALGDYAGLWHGRAVDHVHADLTDCGVPTHDGDRVMSLQERIKWLAVMAFAPRDDAQAELDLAHDTLTGHGVPTKIGDWGMPLASRIVKLAERAKESEANAAHWKAKASGAESAGVDGWTWKDSEDQGLSTYPAIHPDPRSVEAVRAATGAGISDIKQALTDCDGDAGKAVECFRFGQRYSDGESDPERENIARKHFQVRERLRRILPQNQWGATTLDDADRLGALVGEKDEEIAKLSADLEAYKRADAMIQAALATNTRPDPEWNAQRIVDMHKRDAADSLRLFKIERERNELDRELRRERAIVDALAKVSP